jgi:hypothetical protein
MTSLADIWSAESWLDEFGLHFPTNDIISLRLQQKTPWYALSSAGTPVFVRTKPSARQDPPPPQALSPETVEFAQKMFEAARDGTLDLLTAAVGAGLPPNLTNSQGVLPPLST